MVENALDIRTGAELVKYCPAEFKLKGATYYVLTGYEAPPDEDGVRLCFWCGQPLKGKLERYCYGHMKLYYQHFEWNTASRLAIERAGHRCQNCGVKESRVRLHSFGSASMTNLRVHHIVPLNGSYRGFTAFNLPWNLIVFCHDCHQEVHAAMKWPPRHPPTTYEEAIARGQIPLLELAR
jgi:hypothetical protein